ncbi:unnamed protein product [Sphagnum compactum]
MAEETNHQDITSGVESIGLYDDAGHNLKLNQATFFHCVENSNVNTLQVILKHRKIDVNAYNDEGVTALHLAVYKYENSRSLEITRILLDYGADVCIKAAVPPSAQKISIIRKDKKSPHGEILLETKRISLGQKTPLLIALELKSSLYLRGWEYRHWDDMLKLLAGATIGHYGEVKESISASPLAIVQHNWAKVFESGKHELVEVWAEGKSIEVLKLLLSGASKVLSLNLEAAALSYSSRLDLNEASFNVVNAMVAFLYTGEVDHHFMEQRGLDLLLAAHRYGITSLVSLCEHSIHATQDNWIKLLSVALECNSDSLALKCAKSIKAVMDKRHESSHVLKKSFSDAQSNSDQQLFVHS